MEGVPEDDLTAPVVCPFNVRERLAASTPVPAGLAFRISVTDDSFLLLILGSTDVADFLTAVPVAEEE